MQSTNNKCQFSPGLHRKAFSNGPIETRHASHTTKNRIALVKAALLELFIVFALLVVRFTPVKGFLTADKLGVLLDNAGFWAPLVYMIVYAVGVCLFLPGTLLTTLGAAIFGAYRGFVYVWLGAMGGASIAFLIGRYLRRDFAAH